jgi:molybdenum cofactor cytidylyltransferase
MPVAAILLAAGASRRLGRPKQLVEYHRETLLERAIRLAEDSGASPVITVLGAYFAEISAAVPQGDSIRVFNDRWEKGIAGSIHAGLQALDVIDKDAAGVLLLTCDQPRLTSAHLREMLAAFARQPKPSIVASAYGGTLGTPAIFPRTMFSKLRGLKGDSGARSLLAKPPDPLIPIDFPGGEFDIDLPEDLDQLE